MSSDALKSVPFPTPTIEHPFGVELWPVFDKVYSSIMGYAPQDFRFVQGQTSMSTLKETSIALAIYYTVVLSGRELMKNREPFKLKSIFLVHNFYLTAISGGLLALFVEQLVSTIWKNGVFYAICNHDGGWTNKLVILYYLNYLTKYLELLDTVFLVLKKKPLTFLHTYHHGATAALCYSELVGHTPVSWVPITLNLMVHVVMYWYFFQSARGIRITWKEWITRLQIIQFVIDLGFVYFASYIYFTSTYFPWMPNSFGRCAGEEYAAWSGMAILSSYLLLFISFYFATYKKAGPKGRKRSNTASKAAVKMKDLEVPTIANAKDAVATVNEAVNDATKATITTVNEAAMATVTTVNDATKATITTVNDAAIATVTTVNEAAKEAVATVNEAVATVSDAIMSTSHTNGHANGNANANTNGHASGSDKYLNGSATRSRKG